VPAVWAQDVPPVRVRCTIERVDGDIFILKSRDGAEAKVGLADKALIVAIVKVRCQIPNPTRSWDRPQLPARPLRPQSVRRPGSPLTERAVNFIVKEAAERAGVQFCRIDPLAASRSCIARHRQWRSD